MGENRQDALPADRESPDRESSTKIRGGISRTELLNPHFLFNALNTVEALSREAASRIPEVVRGLSAYLRYVLNSKRGGLATVQEELDVAASYLCVEKARFEDRLQVEFQIAEPTPCQRVPEFLLLSLVEHAIQCGMAIGPAPLRVVVSARCLGGWLCIEVSSTGAGAAVETGGDPILERLRRRLALSYKADDYRLTSSQSAAWTSVTIEIAVDKQAGP